MLLIAWRTTPTPSQSPFSSVMAMKLVRVKKNDFYLKLNRIKQGRESQRAAVKGSGGERVGDLGRESEGCSGEGGGRSQSEKGWGICRPNSRRARPGSSSTAPLLPLAAPVPTLNKHTFSVHGHTH